MYRSFRSDQTKTWEEERKTAVIQISFALSSKGSTVPYTVLYGVASQLTLALDGCSISRRMGTLCLDQGRFISRPSQSPICCCGTMDSAAPVRWSG